MLSKNPRVITVIRSLQKPTRCSRATGQMMLKLSKLSHVFNTASRGSASDDALMKSAHRAAGCAMTMTTCPPPPHLQASTRVPARATLVRGRGARPLLRLPYHKLSLSLSLHVFAHSRPPPSAPLSSTEHVCRLPLGVYSEVGLPEFTGVKINRKIHLLH